MRSTIKKLIPFTVQLVKQTPKQSLVTLAAKQAMKFKFIQPQYLLTHSSKATFAVKTINVPSMGDSITEGEVHQMLKKVGDYVELDEVVCSVETDKTQVPIRSPEAGVIKELFAAQGDAVQVGKPFFVIDTDGKKPEGGSKDDSSKKSEKKEDSKKEESTKKEEPKKEDKKSESPKSDSKPSSSSSAPKKDAPKQSSPQATSMATSKGEKSRSERREPLSKMRIRIGERLKDSQNTYALLTTFQECDMSAAMDLRNKFQNDFQKKHNVKLGFMSFFVKAATAALQHQPVVNAVINGKEIVYRNYVDISVAVATPTGLMVPVLRNCENMSFADVEKELIRLGNKGKEGSITVEDMAGGTFTISNGGVFGSLMGTPILNPPQSAILGMHSIVNRPVVKNDQIVARPMMYLALTYDHRLIDGREAVTFLKAIKDEVEDPRRLLLDL